MQSLPELQEGFAAALTGNGAPAQLFRGSAGRVRARLAIYRGNLQGNCMQALVSAYPIARKIVGNAFFEALARAFVRGTPSTSGDLNRYGERLPEFLERFPDTADLPYLPDVARMEWLAHRAHFAADASDFDVTGLATVPLASAGALRLRLAPACALLASDWPLGRIWTIHQHDYHGAFDVDLDASPDRVLVHRPRWRAQVDSLAPGDFAFLDAARRGETLGAALGRAAATDSGFNPSTALAHWVHARVIDRLV
jgi:hypothetical protein